MKNSFLITGLLLLALTARTQTIDSILTAPQTIELSISTPQPRLKETFEIRLDATHIRANIFKSLINNFDFPQEIGESDDNILTMKVSALAKGKNEIGPFEFYLDKTRYTSNKVSYEVVDALPNTDNGIWFRKVMTGANTFCIIIEQRIPAATKSRKTADNAITITTEPVSEEMVEFKDSYSIDGVSGGGSQRNTSFSSLRRNGEEVPFKYGYAIYYFTIDDEKAKIRITRDKFKHLPKDYQFEEIVVQ